MEKTCNINIENISIFTVYSLREALEKYLSELPTNPVYHFDPENKRVESELEEILRVTEQLIDMHEEHKGDLN